ncbi:prepilin peptidase-dependent protein [Pseudocitrobacter cyperus]|uniref:Prepilin peptidase-dependent protein n=1 Tax=Pseudocitrobacter cyperus TaxID=3112843 RepID=A0ABV0HK09_9ENTR
MNREKGYTLIETLVALSLMIILSAGGLYGWQSWQQQQRLWQTATQLRDYLLFLRNDANWHNRDRLITAHYVETRWCLVADTAITEGCPSGKPAVFLPPWPEVSLAAMTPSLGFYGLRNTAWAGSITLQSDAGRWEAILSGLGRVRLCQSDGGHQCQS